MEFCKNSGISGHLLQFFDENAVFQQENWTYSYSLNDWQKELQKKTSVYTQIIENIEESVRSRR